MRKITYVMRMNLQNFWLGNSCWRVPTATQMRIVPYKHNPTSETRWILEIATWKGILKSRANPEFPSLCNWQHTWLMKQAIFVLCQASTILLWLSSTLLDLSSFTNSADTHTNILLGVLSPCKQTTPSHAVYFQTNNYTHSVTSFSLEMSLSKHIMLWAPLPEQTNPHTKGSPWFVHRDIPRAHEGTTFFFEVLQSNISKSRGTPTSKSELGLHFCRELCNLCFPHATQDACKSSKTQHTFFLPSATYSCWACFKQVDIPSMNLIKRVASKHMCTMNASSRSSDVVVVELLAGYQGGDANNQELVRSRGSSMQELEGD